MVWTTASQIRHQGHRQQKQANGDDSKPRKCLGGDCVSRDHRTVGRRASAGVEGTGLTANPEEAARGQARDAEDTRSLTTNNTGTAGRLHLHLTTLWNQSKTTDGPASRFSGSAPALAQAGRMARTAPAAHSCTPRRTGSAHPTPRPQFPFTPRDARERQHGHRSSPTLA